MAIGALELNNSLILSRLAFDLRMVELEHGSYARKQRIIPLIFSAARLTGCNRHMEMHTPALDTLLLTDDELQAARKQVKEAAYFKWKHAGCPENSALADWNEAELEWIEYFYVPDRDCQADLQQFPLAQKGLGIGEY